MTSTRQPSGNPYVGPRAFQRGESLYGRDREVRELLDLLIAERIVLLYSPSGAGKTSLVQAALIPELEKENFYVLPVMRVNLDSPAPSSPAYEPTNRYLLSLLLSLEENLTDGDRLPLADLATSSLGEYLDRHCAATGQSRDLVLVFDQFEEILTLDPTDQAAKVAFFEQVGQILRDGGRWALFSMREDHLAGLDPYLRPMPTRLSTTYRLELLGAHAAAEAIQNPAREAGVRFGAAAATKLVDDLRSVRVQRPDGAIEQQPGPHVEPVQLQVVCRRLWDSLPPGTKEVVEADVEVVGNVDTALAAYYREQVAAVVAETGVRERAIRDWFDGPLITEQGIRSQVLEGRERSGGLDNRAIWPLVDAHLVRAEQRRGATWFELAHDRLVGPVRADNQTWREEHTSPLMLAARAWAVAGKDPEKLYRGNQLREAQVQAEAEPEAFTDLEQEFIRASAEAERVQSARRLRLLLAGAAILVLLFSGLSAWAWSSAVQARHQKATAEIALAWAEEMLTREAGLRAGIETAQVQEQLALALQQVTRQAESEALADGLEATLMAVAAVADTDGDGLSDSDEVHWRTDPQSEDTDGDMLSDGVEVYELGTDPLNPDSDGDGLLDGVDSNPLKLSTPTATLPPGQPTPSSTPTTTSQPATTPRPTPTLTPDLTATMAFRATHVAQLDATDDAILAQLAQVRATQTAEARCPFSPEGEFVEVWQRAEYNQRLGCPLQVSPIDGYWAEQPFEKGNMYWVQLPDWFFVTIGGDKGAWHMQAQSEITWPWNPGTSCEPDKAPGPGLIQPIRGFGGIWCFLDGVQAQIGFATAAEAGVTGNLLQEFGGGFILRDSRNDVYVMFRDGGTNTGSYVRE